MSYVLTLTDGTVLTTIQDGTLQSNIGITLIGRNVPSYGNIQNRNFIKLVENFADNLPPTLSSAAFTPLRGTLWYDTSNQKIRVYDSGSWNPVSEMTVANAAPTVRKLGDQWWNSVLNQLNVWDGNTWSIIGPTYTSLQNRTATVPEVIFDFQFIPQPHLVLNSYVGNTLVSITSVDPTFTADPVAQPNFGEIKPGINVSNLYIINGTVTNSLQLGNVDATGYARRDVNTTFLADVTVEGILSQGNANVRYELNALNVQNTEYLGDINFFVNTPSGNVSALQISGVTGLLNVYGNPVGPLGVANKNYVDTLVSAVNANVTTLATIVNLSTTANFAAVYSNIGFNVNALTTQINIVNSTLGGQINALATYSNIQFAELFANAGTQGASISSINSALASKANLLSPVFTGTPRAPTADPFSNDTKLATTQYVDQAIATLSNATGIGINDEVVARNAAIATATANKADIANPILTGVPRAPTALAGNNSTMIATTQFVNSAVEAQRFRYTVASSPPTGGVDGDFWFQVG